MKDNTFRIEVTDSRILAWVKFENDKRERDVFILSNWEGEYWTIASSMTYTSTSNIQEAKLMHQAISAALEKLEEIENG